MNNSAVIQRSALAQALAVALALPLAPAALAQTAAPANQEETKELDKIVVLGSRIKRSEVEGPAPVTVITAEQMEREGFVTVYDALQTLTQANGYAEGELRAAGGFTPNGSPINLRGLGPGRTLLLINGRRAADYPFPYEGRSNFQNFGNIPSAAVERVEILSGGASAIYGSDAVAGVVNVVLKTNFDGDSLKLRVGSTTEGGGDTANLQWVGGKTGENWSVTYAFEYYYDEPIFGFQRDFMDSRADNPFPGSLGVQPVSTLRISRSAGGANSYFAPPANACDRFAGEYVRHTFRSVSATTGVVTTLGDACGYFADVGYQTISNGNDDKSGYLYGTWTFDNEMEAWASLQTFHSESKLASGVEFISGPHTNGVGTSTTFFATNPGINTNVNAQRIFTPQEYGGLDAIMNTFEEKSYDVAFGLRGTLADRYDWDATIGRAQYDATRERPRFIGSKVTEWFYGPRLNTTGTPRHEINLDRFYTPLTPEQYRNLSKRLRYEADSYVNQASFVLTGDLFNLPAGPVGFAAVIDATSQGYDLDSPREILPTVREAYNLTGTNGGGERDRYAAGLELSVPVLDSVTLSLSGRLDKYDDITAVDDAKTWGAGLEWRPFDSLLVRGNYATSFKAPDMHFVFNEGSGSFSTVLDTFRCLSTGGTAGTPSCTGSTYSYSMFATSKGEPTLKEETGESWTAGFVWDILDTLSLSVDYYDVKLEDAVTQLSSTFIIDNEAGCRTGLTRTRAPYQSPGAGFCQEIISRVVRIAAPGEPTDRVESIRSGPVNQAFRHVSGVDASVDWRMDTDSYGDFRWNLAWSHTLEHERQLFATDPINSNWRDSMNNFDFRSRVRASLAWSKDDWKANLFSTRYGSLPQWQEQGRIAPYILWNVNVGKAITENVRATLFVNNVFNNFHPEDNGFNSYPYFWNSFSPIGREVFAQVEVTF